MTDQLAIYSQFDQLQKAALALFESGYFKDTASKAQAIVKCMAGAELGLPPFASMTGIHIIKGKPVLGSNVIATLVKNDPRYDYRVTVETDTTCTIDWFENGKKIGGTSFTIEEAKKAGLTGKDNWKKYPSDMLFARAISRGSRRHAPGIFGGSPVYTPDEMGADVDEDGHIIDAKVRDYNPDDTIRELGYDVEVNESERPYPPDVLLTKIEQRSIVHATKVAPDINRNILGKMLKTTFAGDDTKRYEFSKWAFGESSVKKIPDAFIWAAFDWLGVSGTDFNDVPCEHAITEVKSALPVALKAQGQQELI